MRLHKLKIQGFRRIRDASVTFGDATFLIGPNNSAKSSVLAAIQALLSAQKLPDADYCCSVDPETGDTEVAVDEVVLDGEFRNLPAEAKKWRGFRGRILQYDTPPESNETGLSIRYRKTYSLGKKVKFELLSKKRTRKLEFECCSTPQELIDAGVPQDAVESVFPKLQKKIGKAAKDLAALDTLDEIWDLSDKEDWVQNPGGIPGNVLSRLPRFLLIPAEASPTEISDKKGALAATLGELFEDVRSASSNYKEAQKYLDLLAEELDPADTSSEFGKMMGDLNEILCSVFPEAQIHAVADLSDPNKVLTPSFNVEMSSNVRTPISHQGTGMVRAAVFALLRYRQQWLAQREEEDTRGLIIGFEEPEIYLHPSAANSMRDTIYELAEGTSQIVSTTHSPFLIDLARRPRQVLNRCRAVESGIEVTPFNTTDEYKKLEADDRAHVKMLLKIDDHIARVFFTKMAIIVEGDSEDIALRQTLQTLPATDRLAIQSDFEVVRARGKAAIIGLAKYFRRLGIHYRVMHDRDLGVEGAERFNEPILSAVGDPDCVTVLEECLEDALGYTPPSKDKPYRAFQATEEWDGEWENLPEAWRIAVQHLFAGYLNA